MKFAMLCIVFGLVGVSCTRQPKEKSVEEIWESASPSIVYVTARNVDGSTNQGSGFVVTLEGKRLVLTNRHVVQGADEVSIGTELTNLEVAPSYKIATGLDLAVVECPSSFTAPPLALAHGPPHSGAEILALGFPLGLAKVITRGIVSSVEADYFLFDAAISSGNSGGPVVNRSGEAIGVATMGSGAREGVVIQNLNVGIRVGAIPKLQLFSDPMLRISSVAERIRETEHFIADGFRQNDFLTLRAVFLGEWVFDGMKNGKPSEWAKVSASSEGSEATDKLRQKKEAWERQYGTLRNGVKTWIEFLIKCEGRVDQLPGAFMGLGVDPLLADFLNDERKEGIFTIQVNATPALLPQLARIDADHWLSRLEDLRYRLEYIDRYWREPNGIPPMSELQNREALITAERPTIRLQFSLSGDREKDLEQYLRTLARWDARREVWEDGLAGIGEKKKATKDPIRHETLHGGFLQKIGSLWQYLAIEAAERGNVEEAITLLRRDMKGRAASCWSGALLAQHLVFAGRIDDAWRAYEQHFQGPTPFDSFELRDGWSSGPVTFAQLHISDGMDADGDLFTKQFGRFPEIRARVREWDFAIKSVAGHALSELGSMSITVTGPWFKELTEFEKLRVLLYYKYVRPDEQHSAEYQRTGKFPEIDAVKESAEFDAALKQSSPAASVWERACFHREIELPL